MKTHPRSTSLAATTRASNKTASRAARRPVLVAALLASLALGLGACASAPRPIPVSNQPVATAAAGSVVVSVPRLDQGDFPGDILEVSTAVLVIIENRGATDVVINPDGFTLGTPEGMRYSPVAPQQLAERPRPLPDSLNMSGVALAWRGGGGGVRVAPPSGFSGGVRSAPVYRGGGFSGGGRTYVSPPSSGFHSGYRGGYYGGYRPGYYAARPWWSWSYPGLWGPGWGYGWYGSTLWWSGPRYYAYSRADAIQMALPAGKLPPGGRTGGFLYFPRIDRPEGAQLILQWQPRDAAGQVVGDLQLPLEMSSSD
jgi:hypothetical protein